MYAEKTTAVTRQLDNSHGSFELVLSPVILALAGWWIDGKVGTSPWFTVVGALLGVIGATIKIVLAYRADMARHSVLAR